MPHIPPKLHRLGTRPHRDSENADGAPSGSPSPPSSRSSATSFTLPMSNPSLHSLISDHGDEDERILEMEKLKSPRAAKSSTALRNIFLRAIAGILLVQIVLFFALSRSTPRDDILHDEKFRALAQENPRPRLAFLFAIHDVKTAVGAVETIRFLHSPHHMYLIHVDAKIDRLTYGKLKEAADEHDNIRVTRRRLDVKWGDISIFDSELHLIEEAFALERSMNVTFDFTMLLCGSSLPLHTEKVLTYMVSKIPRDVSMLFYKGKPTRGCVDLPDNICQRFKNTTCGNKECTFMKGTPNNKLVYKDYQWFFISRAFARFVLDDPSVKNDWRPYFEKQFAPEESVLQTVAMNHPRWAATLKWHERNHDLIHGPMYADWDTQNCKSYVNPRPCCSPCYLGGKDIDAPDSQLVNSKWLFARKFFIHDAARQRVFDNARSEEAEMRRMRLID